MIPSKPITEVQKSEIKEHTKILQEVDLKESRSTLMTLLKSAPVGDIKRFLNQHPDAAKGVDEIGGSALSFAITHHRELEIVKLLVELDPEIMSFQDHDGGYSILLMAMETRPRVGDDVLEYLFEKTSYLEDLEAPCIDFPLIADTISVFHLMIIRDRQDLVPIFLKHISSIDILTEASYTALHLAVMEGNLPMVKLLIKLGASCEIENDMDLTPLGLAYDCDHQGVVDYLEEITKVQKEKALLTKATAPSSTPSEPHGLLKKMKSL